MNRELEKMFLKAGQSDRAYTKDVWYKIIDSLLDDFQKFIGCTFERSGESDISLDLKYPLSPSFTTWIGKPEKEERETFSPSQLWLTLVNNNLLKIDNKNSCSSIKWSGLMYGGMAGMEKDNKIYDVFYAGITIFLFDPVSEKRLYLESGESLLEFLFHPQSNDCAQWVSLGWCKDVYGEWEDVDSF